jgi:hypothetical protein
MSNRPPVTWPGSLSDLLHARPELNGVGLSVVASLVVSS